MTERARRGTIDDAVAALHEGLVVVIPTDTVYGLTVDPSRTGATARLFSIKERPTDVAVPVLAADADQAFDLTADAPDVARKLAERWWPGGLTLVVRRRPGLDLDLGGRDDDTIGVRVPASDLARELARRVGPLAATSANLHGRPTPETADEVIEQLGDADVAVVVDGGSCSGLPSTVVACVEGAVTILREGDVPAEAIRAVVGSAEPPDG